MMVKHLWIKEIIKDSFRKNLNKMTFHNIVLLEIMAHGSTKGGKKSDLPYRMHEL